MPNGKGRSKMEKWEYLVIFVERQAWFSGNGLSGRLEPFPEHELRYNPQPILGELGEEGWELTGVAGADNLFYQMFFKRPKHIEAEKQDGEVGIPGGAG
jgi:hypothetical protein